MIHKVILALLLSTGTAYAHSWYPPECCSDLDCFKLVVPKEYIERREGGWFLLKEQLFIPDEDSREAEDEFFHLCRSDEGKGTVITPYKRPICFWPPKAKG